MPRPPLVPIIEKVIGITVQPRSGQCPAYPRHHWRNGGWTPILHVAADRCQGCPRTRLVMVGLKGNRTIGYYDPPEIQDG